jgi:hypothetical protein
VCYLSCFVFVYCIIVACFISSCLMIGFGSMKCLYIHMYVCEVKHCVWLLKYCVKCAVTTLHDVDL